jgi:hypothetical protein
LEFPGEGYINLGISRGEGTLTLKFPGKGHSGSGIPRGGVILTWNFRGRGKFHGMEIPWEDICYR